MKVLILNGSPHIDGCTTRALKELENTLHNDGIETEYVLVGNKEIRGCIACSRCAELGKCVFDDIVNDIAKKFEEADGLVVGTPTYYAGSNGTILSLLDRLFYSVPFERRMKVGAAVISSRRGGSTSAFDEINKYFTVAGMPVVPSSYWNEVHGFTKEDVERDLEGLQTMRNLGHNMAFLIKAIKREKELNGLPIKESGESTSFFNIE